MKTYVFKSKVIKTRAGSDSCRVTVPAEVCEALDITIGDQVQFEVDVDDEKNKKVRLSKGGKSIFE